jgi:putative transposase
MAHSFSNLLVHVIFGAKGRAALIGAEVGPRLHAYLGGIAREMGGAPIEINGAADHVHLVVRLPAMVSPADALRLLKTNSSRWMHEEIRQRDFAWQAGYAAFSVSESALDDVRAYVARQPEHHRRVSFQDEYIAFLKRHGIEYDERYVWE